MTLCGSLGKTPRNQLYYLLCNHSIWHPIPSFAAVAGLPATEHAAPPSWTCRTITASDGPSQPRLTISTAQPHEHMNTRQEIARRSRDGDTSAAGVISRRCHGPGPSPTFWTRNLHTPARLNIIISVPLRRA